MFNKRDSLNELAVAIKSNSSVDEAFMIFRYRQIIEDELYDSDASNTGGIDYVSALNFENLYRHFRQLIERSAILHFDFWNMLIDD